MRLHRGDHRRYAAAASQPPTPWLPLPILLQIGDGRQRRGGTNHVGRAGADGVGAVEVSVESQLAE